VKVHLPFDLLTFNDGYTTSIDLSKFIYTADDPTTLEKGAAWVQYVTWNSETEDYDIHYTYNENGVDVEYQMNFTTFIRYCLNGEVALVASSMEEDNHAY